MSYLFNTFEGSLAELQIAFDAVDLSDRASINRAIGGDPPDPNLLSQWGPEDDEEIADGYEEGVVISGLVWRTWPGVSSDYMAELDWHVEDEIWEKIKSVLPERGANLAAEFFEGQPLGSYIVEWGVRGCLSAQGVVELRNILRVVLDRDEVALADGLAARSATSKGRNLDECPLICLLATLSGVTEGRDVVLTLA